MADTALASLSDLSARGVDVSNATRAQAAIEDASGWIHHYTSDAWIGDDGELVDAIPGIARAICCNAAQRSLRNPLGLSQVNETAGPFSQSQTFADSSADVYLRHNEIKQLRVAARIGGGLAMLETTRGELETPPVVSRADRMFLQGG